MKGKKSMILRLRQRIRRDGDTKSRRDTIENVGEVFRQEIPFGYAMIRYGKPGITLSPISSDLLKRSLRYLVCY